MPKASTSRLSKGGDVIVKSRQKTKVKTKLEKLASRISLNSDFDDSISGLPPANQERTRLSEADLTAVCIRDVGERLTYLRSRRDLTLDAAAGITGISRAELSRLEKGERRMSEAHLSRIAAAYGLPLSELRDILSYQVKARVKVLSLLESRPSPFETNMIPCYPASDLMAGHTSHHTKRQIVLPKALHLSSKSYAVELDHTADHFILPPNSLILVDPECRVRLGDLVLNTVTWSPIMLKLDRGASEELIGRIGEAQIDLPRTTELSDFHKIIMIMPGAGLFGGLPLRQELG